MNGRAVEALAWVGSLVLLTVAVRQIRTGTERPPLVTSVAVPRLSHPDGDSVRLWTAVARDRNPFRFARRPAAIPFGAEAPPAPQAPHRPELRLLGTIGGPPWQALLAGIPGRAGGTIVSQGQEIEGLRMRRITRDSLVVEGSDTTWRLGVRTLWQ